MSDYAISILVLGAVIIALLVYRFKVRDRNGDLALERAQAGVRAKELERRYRIRIGEPE